VSIEGYALSFPESTTFGYISAAIHLVLDELAPLATENLSDPEIGDQCGRQEKECCLARLFKILEKD
jgi:hypothetical protein